MLGLLFVALQSAVAPPVAQVAPAPAKSTVQQDFEAATALHDNGKFTEALPAWDALERRVASNKRTLAVIRVRKAATLTELFRNDDAVAAARAGLADLPVADTTLVGDRYSAWLTLGRIAERSLDYASAVAAYRQAEPLALSDTERLAALRGLIETGTFVDPDAASRDMARTEALVATLKVDARGRAVLKRVHSQLLLNQGQFTAAQVEAGASVKLLGGLTSRTDLYDVAARSDYAIAALLAGKPDQAREYMAMTGAGRLTKGDFDPGAQMTVPECGGEAGLRPEDVAVVEYSIDDDGTVPSASPVYAAGGGAVALEFARAVRNWSFDPAQVKAMPPFFRNRTRVELRCSTGFERPSIGGYLDGDLGTWLARKSVKLPPLATGSDAAALPVLRTQLAAAEARDGRDALSLVAILHGLGRNTVVPRDEGNAFERRALAILAANDAPPTARLAVERVVWATTGSDKWNPRRDARQLDAALTVPLYDNDASARSAIRLMLADATRQFDERRSRVLLDLIGSDSALPADHPIRVGALIRLASLEQGKGNVDAARAAFARSGLSASQCALLDAPPKLISAGGTFPMEAYAWGFEGWTQVQYDISAMGQVKNQRVIISYPPFIFSKAGAETLAGARYGKSFRPGGDLGCGGTSKRVVFRLPG